MLLYNNLSNVGRDVLNLLEQDLSILLQTQPLKTNKFSSYFQSAIETNVHHLCSNLYLCFTGTIIVTKYTVSYLNFLNRYISLACWPSSNNYKM